MKLPSLSPAALPSAGAVAGTTPFSIILTGCTGTASTVQTFFENGSLVDQANGRLNITTASTAENVQIALLNDSQTMMVVGGPDGTQKSQSVSINKNDGPTTLNYFAQYYATGAASPGTVNSNVSYSLIYQ
ncbi:fimbrial protein [Trinickia violacea]|uniref:fimbrial protein n=1 Tax=Trinickia violacea TaxID=2571746 RepID=UPI001585F9FD|nr:type 1 fimbrial protein [Trinickia violacea]